MVDAFGFETVKTEIELTRSRAERVAYFGVADELMVQPDPDLFQAQRQTQRPFFATVALRAPASSMPARPPTYIRSTCGVERAGIVISHRP